MTEPTFVLTNPFSDIERFGSACDQEPSQDNYEMYLNLITEEYTELQEAVKDQDKYVPQAGTENQLGMK